MAKDKSKETVLVITVGFLAVYLLTREKGFVYASFLVGLLGSFSSYLSRKIDWFWSKLSLALGTVSNGILLSIAFFLVLTPLAIIRRLFVKKSVKSVSSNYITRNHEFVKSDFEKTW